MKTGSYHAKCAKGHQQVAVLHEKEAFPPCGERVAGKPCGALLDWTLMPDRAH